MKIQTRTHNSRNLASRENMLQQMKAFPENNSSLALTDKWMRDFA